MSWIREEKARCQLCEYSLIRWSNTTLSRAKQEHQPKTEMSYDPEDCQVATSNETPWIPSGRKKQSAGTSQAVWKHSNEWTWFLQTFIKLIIYNFTPNTNSPVQLKLSIRIQSPFHFSVMLDTARHHKFKLTFIWSESENMVTRFPPSPPGFAC